MTTGGTRKNTPVYMGDHDLAKILRHILSDPAKYALETDMYEESEDQRTLEKLAGDFEDYYLKLIREDDWKNKIAKEPLNKSDNLVTLLFSMMRDKIDGFAKDLNIAETIQRNLIPEKVPVLDAYEFAAYYHPSHQVGGDYYDFYETEDDRLYFVLADVSGHGVPSSLVVASMQAFIFGQIIEQKSLHAMIKNLNHYLVNNTVSGKFVTLFIGCLEIKSGMLSYINAGHNPPFLLRKDGTVEELKNGGPLLGMFDDVSFTSGAVELKDDDILTVFTDGVTEAMNEEDDEFGEERFLEIVERDRRKPLLGIMLQLFKAIRLFCNGVPYGDDITLLLMRKKPQSSETGSS
ncbi:PP2C family protein-serine/threonine phosphatase [candidate division KSB1 bacterium]